MNASTHRPRLDLLCSLIVTLCLLFVPGTLSADATGQGPPGGAGSSVAAGAEALPGAGLVALKGPPSGIAAALASLTDAYRSQDEVLLAAYSGDRNVDLAEGTARVVLEMDVDPGAQPVGSATTELVTLASGRRAYIQHAPEISIRQELASAIVASGATYETAYENLVQVLAPIESIETLSQIAGVRAIRLPYPATTLDFPAAGPDGGEAIPAAGSVTSEGVGLTKTTFWQFWGYSGAGVNAAIYDFGFTGWAGAQASGDLPGGANLVLKDFSSIYSFSPDSAGFEHGTACADVVHDMAPASKLYLYAFWTDVELGNAISDFRFGVGGKRVATMSVGYVNAGPYDGTGYVNNLVDGAQSSGILWVNSSGNQQKAHWSGTSIRYPGTDWVSFGAGNVQGIGPAPGTLWYVNSGVVITLYLEWNDWNSARTGNQNHIDYDLGLFRWNGSTWDPVASSVANQCITSAQPIEGISYRVPSGGPYLYGLAISRDTGGGACPNNFGHWLQLHSFLGATDDNLFWYVNPCNSVLIPSDGNSAFTVGATFWAQDGLAPLYGLEPFSSLGPRNAAGGGNPGSAVNKPDVVAPDGVSNISYGASDGTPNGPGFFGTSASAPHVAGLAAVVWSRFPGYGAADVRSYVQGQALYRSDGGACGGTSPNNRYGLGRIALPLPGPVKRTSLPLLLR